jgi:hypothetical protein
MCAGSNVDKNGRVITPEVVAIVDGKEREISFVDSRTDKKLLIHVK